MNISVEEKKAEAVARMKALGVFPQTITQLRRSGYVSVSEPPFGAFYWVTDEEKAEIKDFEAENNCLVYMVVRAFTEFGQLDSYLFVSDYEEEWEAEREDISDGYVFTYTKNVDCPDCSEFGCIQVKRTCAAGLLRVA